MNEERNKTENPINFDSDDEDDEPTPQPKKPLPNQKSVSSTSTKKRKWKHITNKFLELIQRRSNQRTSYRTSLAAICPKINIPLVDVLAGMPNYGKFLKEIISNKHKIEQISAAFLSDESSVIIQNKVPPKLGDPGSYLIPCNFNKTFSYNALDDLSASINLMPYSLYAKLSLKPLKPTKISVRLADRSFQYPVRIAENMLVKVVIQVKQKQLNLGVVTERMIFNIDSAMKHSYSNDDTCFSIDVIDEILEEDFDALLEEGSKILYSVEGTLLVEEIFSEFNEFIAMAEDENSESKSDTEEPPFEKITINTDYKIKTSFEEPLTDLELKPLPDNLEYVFLEEPSFLPVITHLNYLLKTKANLYPSLRNTRKLFPGKQLTFLVSPHHSKEIVKLLDTGIIYPIADSPWVSSIYCVPKKGGITVVTNENDELVLRRTATGWRNPSKYSWTISNSFDKCLNNLDKMLQRCKDAHLILNWEKCHFMVKEGIVLGHKVSGAGLEVDKAKIDVISKLPFEFDTPFEFDDECQKAFDLLKEKLTCATVIVSPNWNLLFELMCDTSDFTVGAVLEFDIEIKDRKGTKNVAADHLSRIENDESNDDCEVNDNFPRETLMEINIKDEP
ncbi:reverse transcriptase domain-containing protein [Tanacetum coccineum]